MPRALKQRHIYTQPCTPEAHAQCRAAFWWFYISV